MKRLFGLFLLPFFLFSCSDSIENQLPIFNQSEKGYILKGTVKSPSESEEKSGRMAVPTLNQNIQELIDDTENYKLNIYHNNELKDVTLENGIFTLSLNSGNNQIRVEVLKKNPSAESWCCILQSTEDIEIKANSPRSLSKNFKLKKLQTEGKTGSVMLEIGLDNSIGNVTATLEDADSEKISAWKTALELSDTLTKKCDIIDENNSKKTYFCSDSGESPKEVQIDSGSYRVRFDFYDSEASKNILYSRIQTIEVYDGLLTDKWYEAGSQGGPVNNNNGTFTVDSTAIQDFINTTVYVDPQNGSDTNGGTYYGKLKTLQKAVDTVVARNNIKSGTDEFNIFLCGDVTTEENVTLKSQKKITLNLKSDSSARRVISGSNQASKALFEINGESTTDTTVNFENIQIKGQNNSATGSNNEGKGGGIYVNNATLSLKNCSLDSNNANNGAGIYVDTNGIINIYENTSFTGNNATDSGGAIYNAGIVNMSAGTIGGNTTTSKNTAGNSGGAVYQGGTFNVSGDAFVTEGTISSNDIYLPDDKKVTVAEDNLTKTTVAYITPDGWKRGTRIIDVPSDSSVTLNVGISNKFKLSLNDSDWTKNIGDNSKSVVIASPVYVAGTQASGSTVPTGFGYGKTAEDGALGTKHLPFSTISEAISFLNGDNSLPQEVRIVGTVKGTQTISSNVTASSIMIKGIDSNATLNGNASGSVLTIQTGRIFTIQQLNITNGKADSGGGIYITAGTVNLDSGAKVYSNKATSSGTGAGVYVASGATLNIKTGSEIYSNAAYSGTINGAGVYNAGTVDMTGGQIYNNTAASGGGVYNTGILYVRGTAVVGGTTSKATGSTAGNTCSNCATTYGGGVYNSGTFYLGCDSSGSSSTSGYALSSGYGVRRNYASSGGGIYLAGGTFKSASGAVSYNYASAGGAIYVGGGTNSLGAVTLASNTASGTGGAMRIASSQKMTVNGQATFDSNSVEVTFGSANPSGGAVYVAGTFEITANAKFKSNIAKVSGGTGEARGGAIYNDGTLTMSAGTIGVTSYPNSASNTVSGSISKAYGGAIYQNGTFNVSGSAKVLTGSLRTNDVYLVANGTTAVKQITISGTYNGSGNTSTNKMSVTPAVWKRGMAILGGTSLTYGSTGNSGYFAITDTDWKVRTSSANNGKLDADIYVAGTGYDSTSGVGAGSDTNPGTKSKPFASIKVAAEACWSTSEAFTIYISGMISGSTQTIPAANATAGTTLASKITLQGTSNTTDGIDRGLASSSAVSGGSALIINYQGYVDITNLKIMGGNTTGNGGGILINGSSSLISSRTSSRVNLKNGTLIQQNQAKNGGGVYSNYAILCLSGTATIGSNADTPDRSTASTALSTGINKATTSGGGIYSTSSYLYFGAVWVGSGPNTTGYTLTKGVYGNVCTVDSNATATNQKVAAGGVYNYGVFYFMSGNINCNYGVMTGGVYNNYSTGYGFCMTGGSIHKNNGCGVYNDTSGEFSMSGDAYIGDSGASSRATSATDCSNSKGGLVNVGTAKLGYSYGSKTKLSGGIYRNYLYTGSKNDGGAGIKNTGTLYFDSGTISYNYANCTQSQEAGGGGIFSNSTVYMTSSSSSQYSCVKDNKCSEAGGGIYLDGSSAKLLMSGYAIIGKAGQTTPPSSATAAGANTAKYGAGIGSSGGATICLGYSSFTNMDTNTTESLDNGGICYNYATINGGGIHCQGSSTSSINIYMASGKINANKVYYSNGGTTYGHGGGIWVNMYGTIYMGGGQISKNSAMNNGGGIFTAGKLFMYGNALIGDTGSSVATTVNYGNTAVTGGGVYVTSVNGGVFMGCIKEANGGVQYETLNSSYGIRHNYASGASSDIEPSSGIPTGFGGGVYSNKATLFVASGTIGYNLAAKGGGAAILGQYQSLGYTPCLDDANSKIEGNKATADGGGLYIKKDTFEIRGSISSNTAGSDGGGVYNYWSSLEISGSGAKINSNKAQKGGGIFIPEDGSESNGNISHTTLQNGAQVNSNEATYYGGGIYNYDASLEIHTSNISDNKATNTTSGKGGAMYIKNASYTRIISGTVTMTPTSGYARQARYNDIYPENGRAFAIYSADATISGKVYITLPDTVVANAEIILILGTAPYTSLQSDTYLLTTDSHYYNVNTINTSTGKLN